MLEWRKTENEKEEALVFDQYGIGKDGEETLAVIKYDEECGWLCTSDIIGVDEDYVEGNENEVKRDVEDAIREYFDDCVDNVKETLRRFDEEFNALREEAEH